MEETTLLPSHIDEKEVVYRDRIRSIQRVLAHFGGFTKEYFVSDHGERAALVAVRQGNVLLTRQYRLIINDISWEVPGGGINPGESPEIAATRECLEETGVQCNNLRPLITYHAGLDIWKNLTRVYYTDECQEGISTPSESRAWVSIDRCIEMVFSQQIVDSLSVISLLAYQYQSRLR